MIILTNKKSNKVDRGLLYSFIFLIVIGIVLVFSSSWPEGVMKFDDGYFFIKKHMKFLGIGLFFMYLISKVNYKFYKKMAIVIIVISVTLNLLLFTKFGSNNWGSTRWLDLPFLPSFMPSDVLKVGSIIFIAYILDGLGSNIRNNKSLALVVFFILMFFGLVFVKDLGSAGVILVSLGAMLLVSGINLNSLLFLIILALIGLVIGFKTPFFKYRMNRLTGFLNPFENIQGSGLQLSNSLYALALGNLMGAGPGNSVQKFHYIPHVYNDFIFAVWGEEFGFIGSIILIATYFVFVWRGLLIAFNTKDRFGKYLAVGITTMIGIQAAIHISVNIGIAPVTGITLPFISYGGTSLVTTLIATGILFNISRYDRS